MAIVGASDPPGRVDNRRATGNNGVFCLKIEEMRSLFPVALSGQLPHAYEAENELHGLREHRLPLFASEDELPGPGEVTRNVATSEGVSTRARWMPDRGPFFAPCSALQSFDRFDVSPGDYKSRSGRSEPQHQTREAKFRHKIRHSANYAEIERCWKRRKYQRIKGLRVIASPLKSGGGGNRTRVPSYIHVHFYVRSSSTFDPAVNFAAPRVRRAGPSGGYQSGCLARWPLKRVAVRLPTPFPSDLTILI